MAQSPISTSELVRRILRHELDGYYTWTRAGTGRCLSCMMDKSKPATVHPDVFVGRRIVRNVDSYGRLSTRATLLSTERLCALHAVHRETYKQLRALLVTQTATVDAARRPGSRGIKTLLAGMQP